ncbi:hypothetical protein NEIFL0001_1041 [Neisseria flavescens SK114]|nr:hypothetical protein NEIFL0001_1041 [Neisseria flavescens SK114]
MDSEGNLKKLLDLTALYKRKGRLNIRRPFVSKNYLMIESIKSSKPERS